MKKFRVYYDDSIDETVEEISNILEEYDLQIISIGEEGVEYDEYEIIDREDPRWRE